MRLFFVRSQEVPMGDGAVLKYRGGNFYQVDDVAQAEAFVKAGVAETEEAHDKRLEQEEAARLAALEPKPEA